MIIQPPQPQISPADKSDNFICQPEHSRGASGRIYRAFLAYVGMPPSQGNRRKYTWGRGTIHSSRHTCVPFLTGALQESPGEIIRNRPCLKVLHKENAEHYVCNTYIAQINSIESRIVALQPARAPKVGYYTGWDDERRWAVWGWGSLGPLMWEGLGRSWLEALCLGPNVSRLPTFYIPLWSFLLGFQLEKTFSIQNFKSLHQRLYRISRTTYFTAGDYSHVLVQFGEN